MKTETYRRITKREAIKRFNDKLPIVLCPCKLRPGFPWRPDVTIYGKDYATWDQMYNNWAYYNTSYEAGYYAHYYIVTD